MMLQVLLFSVVILVTKTDTSCTTPLGEKASCIPVKSCGIIMEALLSRNVSLWSNLKDYQCGTDTNGTIMVCCGTRLFQSQPNQRPLISNKLDSNSTCYENYSNPLLPPISECGKHLYIENILEGNENVRIWEFPWLALLEYKDMNGRRAGYKCGGTLISKKYVLTAAHCLMDKYQTDFKIFQVRLGDNAIDSPEDCYIEHDYDICVEPTDVEIEEVAVHANYDSQTRNNDIALIRLKTDVEFSDYVKPICLPNENVVRPTEETEMYVSGWGATIHGRSTNRKLKSNVRIVEMTECQNKFKSSLTKVTKTQICAQGIPERRCYQGDSGGPLLNTFRNISDADSIVQWYQEGIISTETGCGTTEYPGVFTKVSKYVKWIANNMRK